MFHWAVHQNGAPRACSYAPVVVEQEMYCFVGFWEDNRYQIEVKVFSTVSLRWVTLPPVTRGRGDVRVPCRRCGHTSVLIEDYIYTWGGNPSCDLLYAFHVNSHRWLEAEVSDTVPGRRYNHSACVLGKVMYIHGGHTVRKYTNATYKLDTTTMVWSLINTRGTPPPVSSGHSATIIGTNMFVFGGWGRQGSFYNKVRVFDTKTDTWLSRPPAQLPPKGRRFHSAFAYDGELHIFGGYNRDQTFRDLWKFIPETFTWKKVEPKGKGPPSGWCDMCCCKVGDCVVLFGGRNWKSLDDLYILDLSPSLKTRCELAVIQYGVEQKELPHNIRWELAAMNGH